MRSAVGREDAPVNQAEHAPALTHQAEHQVALERDLCDAAVDRLVSHQTCGESHRPVLGTQAGQMVFDASGVAAQPGESNGTWRVDGQNVGAGSSTRSARPANAALASGTLVSARVIAVACAERMTISRPA